MNRQAAQGERFSVLGGYKARWTFFSLDHAEEVYQESQEINDLAWDCQLITKAKENADMMVNAIYEWSDENVWDFIKDRGLEVNPLYEMGFRRVGCVLCPLATKAEKIREMQMFPTYKQAYIRAFDKLLESDTFRKKAKVDWKNGEEVFDWWLEIDKEDIDGQMSLFDDQ